MIQLAHAAVIGNELALAFQDGEELYLSLDMLRRGCPCAACQGEPDALGRVVRPVKEIGERGFDLLKTELVGSTASSISSVWPPWGETYS
jgi:DUF971 family protein